MNVDELTVKEAHEIANLFSGVANSSAISHPWLIGECYLIRTVTMIQVGKLKWVGEQELVLGNAAWIADTGRFHDCLVDPENINESEPFVNDVIIGRGSIIDATVWHNVKVSQK